MTIFTKVFGEVLIEEDKIIVFEGGIVGFPMLTKYILLHDEENGTSAGIRWLQSIDEPAFALPVMDPLVVEPCYNPEIDDDYLVGAGNLTEVNLLVLVTVTVPADL